MPVQTKTAPGNVKTASVQTETATGNVKTETGQTETIKRTQKRWCQVKNYMGEQKTL